MRARKSGAQYRYGYNGQEKDDEVDNVSGSIYNFDFRTYDARLGRFYSVDPLTKKYPELTPYQFASNTPIWARELEGAEAQYSNGEHVSDPFSGETDPAGTKTSLAGPLSDSYSQEQGVVSGDTKGSAIGVTSKAAIISGSVPAKDAPPLDQYKVEGGLAGGHATIDLGQQGNFSFSGNTKLFPKSGDKKTSVFHWDSPEKFAARTYDRQVVSFDLDLTLDQRQSIVDMYQGTPPVDYSIVGFRCASYCLQTLNDIEVFHLTELQIKYVSGVTPGALIRYLENKGFQGTVKPGSPNRVFNTNFTTPIPGAQ